MPFPSPLKYAALALAISVLPSCGGTTEANNDASAAESDSNVMLEQLGNDASALEAAGAATPTDQAPIEKTEGTSETSSNGTSTAGNEGSDQPVLGESKGGDTGGNTVQGNTTGL